MLTALTGIVFMNMCGWVFCSRYLVSLKVLHKFPDTIKIQHARTYIRDVEASQKIIYWNPLEAGKCPLVWEVERKQLFTRGVCVQDASQPLNKWFVPGVVPDGHHFPIVQTKPQDVSPAFPSRPAFRQGCMYVRVPLAPDGHHFPVIQTKPQDVWPAFPSRPDKPAAVFGQRVCISVYNNKTLSRSFPWRWNLAQDKVIKISILRSVLVFRE